jgi:single-stranded DNA-binding protein
MSESGMNLVMLSGQLECEPEIRKLPLGTPICLLRLCGDRPRIAGLARNDGSEYLDVIVLGPKVWQIAPYLFPGRHVVLEGSLEWEGWEDGEGPEQESVCVLAERVCFGDACFLSAPVGYATDPSTEAPEISSSTSRALPTG